MNKILLDSGEMSIDGNRERIVVAKTSTGIEVFRDSLYSDEPATIKYFRDGNYPPIPEDWDDVINGAGITEDMYWETQMEGRTPDRIIDPYKRAKKLGKSNIYWFLDEWGG